MSSSTNGSRRTKGDLVAKFESSGHKTFIREESSVDFKSYKQAKDKKSIY